MERENFLVGRFLKLPGRDRFRVIEAFLFLGIARMAVLTIPFRIIARTLGQASNSPQGPASGETEAAPATIHLGRLIEGVSHYTPWDSNCLAKAIAATFMLRRRGVKTTMHFGVAKNAEGKLDAHAWTCCGRSILTGRNGVDRYAVIATFAEPPSPAR